MRDAGAPAHQAWTSVTPQASRLRIGYRCRHRPQPGPCPSAWISSDRVVESGTVALSASSKPCVFTALLAGECSVQRCLHRGVDLGAGVSFRRCRHAIKIKLGRIPFPPCQMNRKNLLALGLIRQVDEKQFVEAPFANQFRRQDGDVVAGGGHEHRSFAILHPGKKGGQNARGNAGIDRRRIRPASGKDFFQFVNPEHAGRKTFGDAKHFLNSLLGLADVLVEDGGSIELHQRQLPLSGNGASAHALAAALHSENDYSSRRLQAEVAGCIFPGATPLRQPAL